MSCVNSKLQNKHTDNKYTHDHTAGRNSRSWWYSITLYSGTESVHGLVSVRSEIFDLASDTNAHWLLVPSTKTEKTVVFSITSQLDQVALTGRAAELQMLADCGIKTYKAGRTSSILMLVYERLAS